MVGLRMCTLIENTDAYADLLVRRFVDRMVCKASTQELGYMFDISLHLLGQG